MAATKTDGGRTLYNLPSIYARQELSDVTVEVNSVQYKLHRVMLASCSDYFYKMFCGQMKESSAEGCDVVSLAYDGLTTDAFRILLDFVYTAKLNLSRYNVLDVCMAADYLQMLEVITRCGEFLLKQVENETGSLGQLLIIDQFVCNYDSLKEVQANIAKSMALHFGKLAETKEFRKILSFEKLHELIQRDDLAVKSETQTLRSVIRWVEADEEKRTEYLSKLLSHVRLALIDVDELTVLMDKDKFREVPDWYDLYVRTLRFHAKRLPSVTDGHASGCVDISTTATHLNLKPRHLATVYVKFSSDSISCHYDNKWIKVRSDSPLNRNSSTSQTLLNGKLLIGSVNGDFCEFNQYKREWKRLETMIQYRKSVFLIYNGKDHLYTLGGMETSYRYPVSYAERYHLSTNKWKQIASLPASKGEKDSATLYNDRILYLTQGTGYSFDPEKNQWIKTLTYGDEFKESVFSTVIDGRLHLFKDGMVKVYREDGAAWDDISQTFIPVNWKSHAFIGIDTKVYIVTGNTCLATGIHEDRSNPYAIDMDDWEWARSSDPIFETSFPIEYLKN